MLLNEIKLLALQMSSRFPNDNLKHIDYVIKYEEKEPEDHEQLEHESYRKLFFDEIKNQSIQIYLLEVKSQGKRYIYALLHCPIERLLAEAEAIKLEMNLKTVFNSILSYFLKFFILFIKI